MSSESAMRLLRPNECVVDFEKLKRGPLLRRYGEQVQRDWRSDKYPLELRLILIAAKLPNLTLTAFEDLQARRPSMAFLLHDGAMKPSRILGPIEVSPLVWRKRR